MKKMGKFELFKKLLHRLMSLRYDASDDLDQDDTSMDAKRRISLKEHDVTTSDQAFLFLSQRCQHFCTSQTGIQLLQTIDVQIVQSLKNINII